MPGDERADYTRRRAVGTGRRLRRPLSKRAFEPCWSTSPPKIAEELRQDYRDGYNIGFRAGDWSKLDGWPVVVLDADIRSDDPAHREAARSAWRELVGDMKPTVKTGGGGAHLYLRCPPDKLPLDQSIVSEAVARHGGQQTRLDDRAAIRRTCGDAAAEHPSIGASLTNG